MAPVAYVKRRETFSAAHRLHSTQLSDEDNQQIFGKCNHPGGHGHNYGVEVTIKGKVDRVTGMVVNLTHVKAAMANVIEQLDHKNLDVDVPFFKDHASTAENVALFIWGAMNINLSITAPQCTLFEVVVEETEKNKAIYRGEVEDDEDVEKGETS